MPRSATMLCAATVTSRLRATCMTVTPVTDRGNLLTVYGGYMDDEELLLAVANTAHGEQDELADADAVSAWWHGLGAPATSRDARPGSPGSVAMLRDLRVLIRGLALRNNGIEPDLSV